MTMTRCLFPGLHMEVPLGYDFSPHIPGCWFPLMTISLTLVVKFSMTSGVAVGLIDPSQNHVKCKYINIS